MKGILNKYVDQKSKTLSFIDVELNGEVLKREPYTFNEVMKWENKYDMIIAMNQYVSVHFNLNRFFNQVKERLKSEGILVVSFEKKEYQMIADYLKCLAMFEIEEVIESEQSVICVFKVCELKVDITVEKKLELRQKILKSLQEAENLSCLSLEEIINQLSLDKYEVYSVNSCLENIIKEYYTDQLFINSFLNYKGSDEQSESDAMRDVMNGLKEQIRQGSFISYAYEAIGPYNVLYAFDERKKLEELVNAVCNLLNDFANGEIQLLRELNEKVKTVIREKLGVRETLISKIICKQMNLTDKELKEKLEMIDFNNFDRLKVLELLQCDNSEMITLNYELRNFLRFRIFEEYNFAKIQSTLQDFVLPYRNIFIYFSLIADDECVYDCIRLFEDAIIRNLEVVNCDESLLRESIRNVFFLDMSEQEEEIYFKELQSSIEK